MAIGVAAYRAMVDSAVLADGNPVELLEGVIVERFVGIRCTASRRALLVWRWSAVLLRAGTSIRRSP
jgi:hypothetical protein